MFKTFTANVFLPGFPFTNIHDSNRTAAKGERGRNLLSFFKDRKKDALIFENIL